MKIFNTTIIKSETKDPYVNNNNYIEHKRREITYNEKKYEEITYKRDRGFCWKLSQFCLALLASITLIPLCIDAEGVGRLWKQVFVGEIQIVLIAKKQLEQPKITPSVSHKSVNIPEKKGQQPEKKDQGQKKEVQFNKVRAREFDKELPPDQVGNLDSVTLENLQENKNITLTQALPNGGYPPHTFHGLTWRDRD